MTKNAKVACVGTAPTIVSLLWLKFVKRHGNIYLADCAPSWRTQPTDGLDNTFMFSRCWPTPMASGTRSATGSSGRTQSFEQPIASDAPAPKLGSQSFDRTFQISTFVCTTLRATIRRCDFTVFILTSHPGLTRTDLHN